jgi:hypothetical protein
LEGDEGDLLLVGVVDVLKADVVSCCLATTGSDSSEFDTHCCGKVVNPEVAGKKKIAISSSF